MSSEHVVVKLTADAASETYRGFRYTILQNRANGTYTAYLHSIKLDKYPNHQEPSRYFSKFALPYVPYGFLDKGGHEIPTISMRDKVMLNRIAKLTIERYAKFIDGME